MRVRRKKEYSRVLSVDDPLVIRGANSWRQRCSIQVIGVAIVAVVMFVVLVVITEGHCILGTRSNLKICGRLSVPSFAIFASSNSSFNRSSKNNGENSTLNMTVDKAGPSKLDLTPPRIFLPPSNEASAGEVAVDVDNLLFNSLPLSEAATWEQRVDRWNSMECQEYYFRSEHSPLNNHSTLPAPRNKKLARTRLPLPFVRESLNHDGRSPGNQAKDPASKIVYIDAQYKFVYVETRKSASTSMRGFLTNKLQLTWGMCPVSNTTRKFCMQEGRRCTAACLDEDHIRDYFFFTFVRNPYTRYPSQVSKERMPCNTTSMQKHLSSVLSYEAKNLGGHHYESQAASASASWQNGRYRVPMDYIGRVEYFTEDLQEIFRMIEKHSGVKLPFDVDDINEFGGEKGIHYNVRDKGNSLCYNEAVTPRVNHMIANVYGQDFVCFGYNTAKPPEIIIQTDDKERREQCKHCLWGGSEVRNWVPPWEYRY